MLSLYCTRLAAVSQTHGIKPYRTFFGLACAPLLMAPARVLMYVLLGFMALTIMVSQAWNTRVGALDLVSYSSAKGEPWSDALRRLSGATMIWISVVNRGFLPYALHFIGNIQALGLAASFPLIIVCLDDTSMGEIQSRWPHVVSAGARGAASETLEAYNTTAYVRIVLNKLDAMHAALSRAASFNIGAVGVLDFDTALRVDPTPLVIAELDAHPSSSVVAQCDESSHTCSNPHRCPGMCAGVYAVRTSEASKLLPIFRGYETSDTRSGEQVRLQRAFAASNITVRSLDKTAFPNGWSAGFRGKAAAVPPNDTVIQRAALVHFNFLLTCVKEKTMREWGMWFGDPTSTEPNLLTSSDTTSTKKPALVFAPVSSLRGDMKPD